MALEKVLALKIPEERYEIELKLILQIRFDFDMKQKERLRNAVVKHKQVLNNIVNFRMTEVDNINLLIKKLEYKMLHELIIDIKILSGERVFLAIGKL